MPYVRNGYKGAVPTLKDFYRLLKMQPETGSTGAGPFLGTLFITGTLGTFAQPTNVDTKARIIAYDIRELGETADAPRHAGDTGCPSTTA